MFSRAATTTLTNVARRRATVAVAKNGSKLTSPLRALSDVAAAAPKQPIDIPPAAGKHWRAGGSRHCHGHGKRVVGKVVVLGAVGYGGYRYGLNSSAPGQTKAIPSNVGAQSFQAQASQVEAGSSQK